MVGLNLSPNPFPYSSSSSSCSSSPSSSCSSMTLVARLQLPSTTVRFSGALVSTSRLHGWFSLLKFSKASRIELKPLLAEVGLRPNSQISVQCSCISTPNKLQAEAGEQLSESYSQTQLVLQNGPTIKRSCLVSGLLFAFFREIGVAEREMEILLEKNPALALTSLDSIRARVQSLQSIGINGLELCYLVTKSSGVLTAEDIGPLISFVHDELEGKIEPAQLKRLLTSAHRGLLRNFEQKVKLLLHHGVPREKIVHVLNKVNLTKAFGRKSLEDIDRTMSYLSCFGSGDLIVKRPVILNFDLDSQLIPRIGFLVDLSGGDKDATGEVLRKFPMILSYSLQHVEGHVEFLKSFAGLNDQEIFKILLVFPGLVSTSKERKLRPRIEFLKQCGLGSDDILRFLTKAPLFLGLSFDNLACKLAFLVKIGYRHRTRDIAMAMGSVTRTSCENLQKVIELFLSYGFSDADLKTMSKKHPQILQYNHISLEEKMEYLIEDMGREVEELLAFPAFLGYKFDERIKARYEAEKSILGEGMSLNKLLTVSTERFLTKKKGENSVTSG